MSPPPQTDLQLARASCTLDVLSLGTLILPPSQRRTRDSVASILEREPLWDPTIRHHLNQTQSLTHALRICKRLLELRTQHRWSVAEYRCAILLDDEPLPTVLHESTFMAMIYNQGTEEQRELWLPPCARLEFVGCYAQTEVSHGSNIQGLLTTATYTGPESDEFIVDSGGIEGAKWWIGGAGVLANFALVQAILRVPKKEGALEGLGPHLFIVPLRDLENHDPLPGVTVGDIGPKSYGSFAALDNGYIKFDGVRIPRQNMLMRFNKLEKGGKYTPGKHKKLSYGSMVALRAGIPEKIGWSLAKAVTTAIRYCVVRRQFTSTPGEETETQVIHYAAVKHRLYPILAQTYAYLVGGREFWAMYRDMQEAITSRGDVGMLAEVHSLSTALKVATSHDGAKSLEVARSTMGGHGASWMSGVGAWFANKTLAQTYEGENYVIAQQIARALVKHVAALTRDQGYKLPESSQYLRLLLGGSSTNTTPPWTTPAGSGIVVDWRNPEIQIELLETRAAYLTKQLALAKSSAPDSPWQDFSAMTFPIALAHGHLYLCRALHKSISSQPPSPSSYRTTQVLQTLASIYSLSTIVASLGDLLEAGALTPEQSRDIKTVYSDLVERGLQVSDVVGLTDAFGLRDWEVGVMGCSEGKVYERMWQEVSVRGSGAREYEGVKWEDVKGEARRVLGHWKEEGRRGAKL